MECSKFIPGKVMVKKRAGWILMIVSISLVLWSGCTDEDDPFVETAIEATFGLTSRSAMSGKITVGETFLKLDRINAIGTLGGITKTSVTQSIPAEEPPYKLTMADSNQVALKLSSRVYDRLEFQLFLATDGYELISTDAGPVEVPAPVENGDGESNDDNGGQNNGDDDSEDDGEGDRSNDDNNDEGDRGGEEDDDHEDDEDDGDGDDEEEDDDDNDDKKGDKDKEKKNKDDDKEGRDEKDKSKGKDKKNNGDGDDDDDNGRTSEGKNRIVDLDHFFQNAKPGMVVFGIYENNGKVINIIFIGSGIEKITVMAKQSGTIVLAENNTARINFDPERWLDGLSAADIESAQLQTYQQQTVLFIHKDYNTELFQLLAPRIEGALDMSITAGADTVTF